MYRRSNYPQAQQILAGLLCTFLWGCAASNHPTAPAELGRVSSAQALHLALQQNSGVGPIGVEKIVSATWAVDRAGLINLEHPTAQAAGLTAGAEPIKIFVFRIVHPKFGTFLIDSGVAAGLLVDEQSHLSWLVRWQMNTESMTILQPTRSLLSAGVAGVFLTHLHLDHIFGLPDLPRDVPVYVGRDELATGSFTNAFTSGSTDRLLGGLGAVQEWQFEADPAQQFAAVLDVFGDGSLWAIHAPGHSDGSTAYIALADDGAHLFLGDVSHTRWGWENNVEPGNFTTGDRESSKRSLLQLRALSAEYPTMQVYPGHQD